MPRSGLTAAITVTPLARRRSMTPFQLELSAKAPCTSTTVSGDVVVCWDMGLAPRSSEREHVGLDAGVEELDLEQPVADRRRLADQLVHPRVAGGAVAGLVDVDAVRGPGWFAVEADPEPHGRVPLRRAHDEVEVTGVEPVGEGTAGRAELRRLLADEPVAREGPLVAVQVGRRRVGVALVRRDAAGRGEAQGAAVADVALR